MAGQFKVTPWTVTGNVDYEKLTKEFGTEPITEQLLKRIEKHTKELHPYLKRKIFFCHRDLNWILDEYEKGNKFFLYTGRASSKGSKVHIGHLIPWIMCKWLQDKFNAEMWFQFPDEEKFLYKKELTLEDTEKATYEDMKDVIALGFNPKKTFFLIVGSGPMEKELREKIRNKGILGNTKIAGHVSYEKLMGIYKACDMVVFPSVWQEPFGRVSVEAMAAGKAVVASRVGGINETIEDNVNGFLVEPNNIGQWQNRIVELLADDIKRNKFGRKGRETVKQKFDKMVIAKKILEQYKEVL